METAQHDIKSLLTILNKSKSDPDRAQLTNLLTFINKVNDMCNKIDQPLKIITGAATTTKEGGLADLFANYFTLKASEDLTQTGKALLTAGQTVLMDNYNAYKALGIDPATEEGLSKVTKEMISNGMSKLDVAHLTAFTKAAQAHQANLDKYLKQLDTTDDGAKKLKASLILPQNYAETFTNLEAAINQAPKATK